MLQIRFIPLFPALEESLEQRVGAGRAPRAGAGRAPRGGGG